MPKPTSALPLKRSFASRPGDVRVPPAPLPWGAVPGWFDFPGWYDRIVREAPAGATVVEVGAWYGRSVIYLAQRAQAVGKPLKIFAVDTFAGSAEHDEELRGKHPGHLFHHFVTNTYAARVAHMVTPMTMTSLQAARLFGPRSVFAVFIDAEHTYDAVRADIAAWRPAIVQGGYISGHDYLWDPSTVKRAVDEAFPARELQGSTWIQRLD